MIGRLMHELRQWKDAVRARFDRDQPPVLGWQLPFFGCAPSMGLSGPRWLREQSERVGSPFTLYMMGQRITFAQDLEFQHHFYTAGLDQVSFFAGLEAMRPLRELLPFGVSGPEGANVGLDVLRQFLPGRIAGAAAELDAGAARCLRDGLASGRGDLLALMREAVTHITALLIVGPRLAGDREFLEGLWAFDDALTRNLGAVVDRRPVQQGLAARDRVVARVELELQRRRAEAHEGASETSAKRVGEPVLEGAPRDVADALLRYRSSDGAPLPDRVMALDLQGFMFATTANTPAGAAMCLLHVLADPALHRRVVDEQEVCRREHGDAVTPAAMKAMPLLNACYLETLRLYSPPMHVRMTMEPLQVGRYRLPERSMIGYSPYLLHRDPAVYTDPEVFDPERFLGGPRGPGRSPSTHHYVPYGRGVHTCLGRNLARQEILACVARLLRDFEITLEPVDDPLAVSWAVPGIATPAGPRTLRARPTRGARTC